MSDFMVEYFTALLNFTFAVLEIVRYIRKVGVNLSKTI